MYSHLGLRPVVVVVVVVIVVTTVVVTGTVALVWIRYAQEFIEGVAHNAV